MRRHSRQERATARSQVRAKNPYGLRQTPRVQPPAPFGGAYPNQKWFGVTNATRYEGEWTHDGNEFHHVTVADTGDLRIDQSGRALALQAMLCGSRIRYAVRELNPAGVVKNTFKPLFDVLEQTCCATRFLREKR